MLPLPPFFPKGPPYLIDSASVYDPLTRDAADADADADAARPFRLLVTRYWPRGVSVKRARIDGWCRDLAPDPVLLRAWQTCDLPWGEFADRYLTQITTPRRMTSIRFYTPDHNGLVLSGYTPLAFLEHVCRTRPITKLTLLCVERLRVDSDNVRCHRHLLTEALVSSVEEVRATERGDRIRYRATVAAGTVGERERI